MTQQNRPEIEFPSRDYPVKVVGDADPAFRQRVVAVLQDLSVEFSDSMREAPSRNGRFVSLTIFITAEHEAQLQQLNSELRKLDFVRMVL